MAYTMGDPPNSKELNELWEYVMVEFLKLQEESQKLASELEFFTYNVAPGKVWDGLTVKADGVNWNPGSGPGVYCYYGGTWNYLG